MSRSGGNMAKFFNIEEDVLVGINRLMQVKRDRLYVVLQEANGFTDIAQYSDKYQNIRIVTVPSDRLDKSNRLA